MTVPQPTPEHRALARRRRRYDPWAAPPSAPVTAAARPGSAAAGWGRSIRDAGLVALPVALLTGVVLGLLWLRLSPRLPLVSNGEAVLLDNSEGEQPIAIDGTFLLLGLAVGAVAGVVVFLLRRDGGWAVPLGLCAGALLGAVLAWRLGVALGPGGDIAARAREAGQGVTFDAPLRLQAMGVLFGLPFAAVAAYLVSVAGWGPRDALPAPHGQPDAPHQPPHNDRGPDPTPDQPRA